ncbi:MAG TPA: tRNA pseudouridine(55) synthase TruB [Longimicrobium sp.]|uniref:tRNA pseudouridine(55) synthase TruB n=1 Tax=Longimicrobium sp. TaxID=2029185 RepID=UPI002EDA6AC0
MTAIPLNGVLALDKPVGPTSHDAVSAVRRALHTRAVGHTGTLDPFASGLLLVCVGPATRLAEYITPLPKTYVATIRLGAATDTDDHTGTVISTSGAWRDLSAAAVQDALAVQVGTIEQVPPAYSAKKVDGERMYAVARRGGEVERTPVTVTIHAIRVLSIDLPDVVVEVECGSGTYIRAIARDAGDALGVGGHLTALRRTRIGPHDVDRAVRMEALDDEAGAAAAMIAPAESVSHLPRVVVDDHGRAELGFGRAVEGGAELAEGTAVAIVDESGVLLAIGLAAGGRVRPRKVLAGG